MPVIAALPSPPALVAPAWQVAAAAPVTGPAPVEPACARPTPTRAAALQALRERLAAERELPLLAAAESRLAIHEPPTGKGTVVLLHGWSAATNQFDEMTPVLFEAGYDVWTPRLLGHGLKDPATGQPDPTQLPRAGEFQRYTAFADEVHALASRLGGPVHLVGLSGGAAVALDVAERHPDVGRVVAMAPFLNIPSHAKAIAPHVVDFLDTVLLGPTISSLDLIPYSWAKEPGDEAVVGYNQFKVGNVTALRRFGYQVGEFLDTGVPVGTGPAPE
ncbi:MAG: alpha/beta fold hydrolase [Candidatus Sericytochromatia bacterium]|nr:alpha/beta fold hydrolase [Candidatus Sericytochromatia bacterium]